MYPYIEFNSIATCNFNFVHHFDSYHITNFAFIFFQLTQFIMINVMLAFFSLQQLL